MGHVKSSTDVAVVIAGLACERSNRTPLIRWKATSATVSAIVVGLKLSVLERPVHGAERRLISVGICFVFPGLNGVRSGERGAIATILGDEVSVAMNHATGLATARNVERFEQPRDQAGATGKSAG